MISSETRFIRTSSFSISTRTVLFTTGLPKGFLPPAGPAAGALPAAGAGAGAAPCAGTAAGAAAAAGAGSGASSAAAFSASRSNSPHSHPATSETDLTISMTFSFDSSVIITRLNEKSNFSSSISCVLGSETTISPISSIPLNTRKPLAALRIQDS